MGSAFKVSGDSPATGELGAEKMKPRKYGMHAADTWTNNDDTSKI